MHARRAVVSYGDPVIRLKGYGASDARADVVAGIVLTALAVPAGMGYAEAAGLPPVTGLYATIVALVAYALVGPSSILVIAPDSSLAPIIASAILPLAGGDTDRAIALAGVLAIISGAVLLIGGIVRLGFVADLLVEADPSRLPRRHRGGDRHRAAAEAVRLQRRIRRSAAPLARLRRRPRRWRDRQPGARARAARARPRRRPSMASPTCARVPHRDRRARAARVAARSERRPARRGRARPRPAEAGTRRRAVGRLPGAAPAAVGLALVVFADSGILSRTFSLRRGERVDENSEMRAVGITNIATGVLGGFPVAASSSRTPAAEAAGARTQVTALASAAMTALLLLAAPGATEVVPSSALAAVVIVAAAGLVEPREFVHLAGARMSEFGFAVAAFLGVVIFGVLEGIGVAVRLALLAFVARAWRPYATELVRVDQRKGYHDIGRHPNGRRVPGLVIARFDAPLFFANGAALRRVRPDAGRRRGRARALGGRRRRADHRRRHHRRRRAHRARRPPQAPGIQLVFAEMKGPAKDRLVRYGLGDRFPQYPTLGTAVDAYLDATGTEWVDWEDRQDAARDEPQPGDTRDQDGGSPPVA